MIPIWNNIKNYNKMGMISALNDKTYQKIGGRFPSLSSLDIQNMKQGMSEFLKRDNCPGFTAIANPKFWSAKHCLLIKAPNAAV